MTSNSDTILKSWLKTLRFDIEYYEDAFEPINRNNTRAENMVVSDDSEDGNYVNLWDCSLRRDSALRSSSGNVSAVTDLNEASVSESRKYKKKPIATPRSSKSTASKATDKQQETIYQNVTSLKSSESIYENIPVTQNIEEEPIYENIPITSTSFEDEIYSTIQILERVIDSAEAFSDVEDDEDSSSDVTEYASIRNDDSTSDLYFSTTENVDNNNKFTESSSSFEEYCTKKTEPDKLLFQRFSKDIRLSAFCEDVEPEGPRQEVKSIPTDRSRKSHNGDYRKRFSVPLGIQDDADKAKLRPKSWDSKVTIQAEGKDAAENAITKSKESLCLSFADESTLDTSFEEGVVEELEIVQPLLEDLAVQEQFLKKVKEGAVLWMTLLMEEYWGELEDIMEEKELLKSINQVPKDRTDRPTENKFPLDDHVELRRRPEVRTNRLSKTTDFDVGRRKQTTPYNTKNFEIRGIIKIDLPSSKPLLTKWKEEYIAYDNENLYRINERTRQKEALATNVTIKSLRYLKNKECKEVELKDTSDQVYILHFQDLKYAKQFMENDKTQAYITDNKVTIKKTLLRFLGKRSSREILERKGIYKNEPIFGNTLRDIYIKGGKKSLVPAFVCEVIMLLERPENINSLGLYRTSGNLATIQKIRFEVDNGSLGILDQYAKDPDVLTGSLKLFFRELKEPLVGRDVCDKLLESSRQQDVRQMTSKDHQKIRITLMKNLHEANLETFAMIMRHLLEVIKYKECNKMDTYNLAVCWGPSMIFPVVGTDINATIDITKDIVTQSQDAIRLVDFLLVYYEMYPAELAALTIRPKDSRSEFDRFPTLKRQESKSSVGSVESSKSSKQSASSLSLSVDEVAKKLIEYIEPYISSDGLYRKAGSQDKVNKIMKKLNKKKINELDKYKNDVHELADALKKYLKEQDSLITDEVVLAVLRTSPDTSQSCLEPVTRRKVIALIESTPKKDTFIFLLRHMATVLDHQFAKEELLNAWAGILVDSKKSKIQNDDFTKFLAIAVKVFNDNLPDVVRSSFNNNSGTINRNGNMEELMKEMKHQHEQSEKDRNSRYDNVDSDVGEASILDEKTEQTKL